MLKSGSRWRSQVCDTEIIVVRPDDGVKLGCGGHPMVPVGETPAPGLHIRPDLSAGTQLGKRYTNSRGVLEVLVTRPGAGTLTDGDEPLVFKPVRQLPASD